MTPATASTFGRFLPRVGAPGTALSKVPGFEGLQISLGQLAGPSALLPPSQAAAVPSAISRSFSTTAPAAAAVKPAVADTDLEQQLQWELRRLSAGAASASHRRELISRLDTSATTTTTISSSNHADTVAADCHVDSIAAGSIPFRPLPAHRPAAAAISLPQLPSSNLSHHRAASHRNSSSSSCNSHALEEEWHAPRSTGSSSSSSGSSSGAASSSSAASESATSKKPLLPADPLAEVLGSQLASSSAATLTPRAIVSALDSFIIGQQSAKRAVAIALRNRWRRHQLPQAVREEVLPKNILMVGPTGCGKTEIARRLAKLVDAPFLKVEATKYTELGYVGRDVEDMIKDLVEASISSTKQRLREALASHAEAATETILLKALCGEIGTEDVIDGFREIYRRGEFDNTMVDIPTSALSSSGGNGVEQLLQHAIEQLRGGRGAGVGGAMGVRTPTVKMKVSEARKILSEGESDRWLSSELVMKEALRAAEEDGIVFIDEIDKIVDSGRGHRSTGGNVSNEGVQRDLLPILEGCQVSTKHGNINTEHILFICSGAFHSAKPSDMLAELQGRLPIRVELTALTQEDFYRILTEPKHNMIEQHQELLRTEGVDLHFTDGAVHAIAAAAEEANRSLDNIGARRLHTVLERILSDISYSAPDKVAAAAAEGQQGGLLRYEVDEQMVEVSMRELLKHQDLSRYML